MTGSQLPKPWRITFSGATTRMIADWDIFAMPPWQVVAVVQVAELSVQIHQKVLRKRMQSNSLGSVLPDFLGLLKHNISSVSMQALF